MPCFNLLTLSFAIVIALPTLQSVDALAAGQEAYSAGRFTEALERFESFIASRPNDPRGYGGAGRSLARLRRYQRATTYFERADDLQPGKAATIFDLASCLHRQARFAQAILYWRKLDQLDDPALAQRSDWIVSWGVAASKLEREPEALEQFRRAVSAEPANLAYRERLGKELLKAGNFRAAAVELKQVARARPKDAGLRYHLGSAYLQDGQDAAAEKELLEARRLKPEDSETAMRLGKLYLRQKRYPEATQAYEAGVRINPLNHEGWHALARLAQIRGDDQRAGACRQRFEEIRAAYDKEVERLRNVRRRVANDPRALEAYREAAKIFLEQGKTVEAEEWLTRLLAVDPSDVGAILNLSSILAQRGDLAGGLLELAKILEQDPQHGLASLNAGKILCAQRRWPQAIQRLETSLPELREQRVEAHTLLVTAYRATGNERAAEEHLRIARSLGSGD